MKGQESCTTFELDEKQTLFLFGGHYKKFGKFRPFISAYKKTEQMITHLDTKTFDNIDGNISHIKMDSKETVDGIKIGAYADGNLIVMRLKKGKLEHIKCVKDLHRGWFFFLFSLGGVCYVRRFRNKLISCGRDGVIKAYDIGFGNE